ncbi:MAG: ISL3 family transposase, partial [Clostridia bacterium]
MGNVLMEKLLNIPEFEVTDFKQNEYDMGFYVQAKERPKACPVCGIYRPEVKIHKTRKQTVRDLNVQGKRVALIINRKYYYCNECGAYFSEPLQCVVDRDRMTLRLRLHIAEKAAYTPFVDIQNEYQVSDTTVRKAFLERVAKLPTPTMLETPSILGIDEICLKKNEYHRKEPWAVIANGDENTVIEMLRNRSKPSVISFLQNLKTPHHVEVVTMDMWSGYRSAVHETLPQALVVVDKFHVVKMANKQMDDVRARYSRTAPIELKRNKNVFLMHDDNLSDRGKNLRDEWFQEYPVLAKTYEIKENFFHLYECPTRLAAEKYFLEWKRSIPKEEEYNGYRALARTINRCHDEVFNYFDSPNTN